MTEEDVEIVVQRAKEKFPNEHPRIISDNGAQFIARDFKELIRLLGMTHVRTSPGYPQSNGKLERWHGTIKSECIRPGTPLSLEDALRLVARWVEHYNHVRLHSALGYVTPRQTAGRENEILRRHDRKLEAARERRRQNRARQTADDACYTSDTWTEDRALLGSNPSNLRARSEDGRHRCRPTSTPSRFWPHAINPRRSPVPQPPVPTLYTLTQALFPLANSRTPKLNVTLNSKTPSMLSSVRPASRGFSSTVCLEVPDDTAPATPHRRLAASQSDTQHHRDLRPTGAKLCRPLRPLAGTVGA